MSEAMDYERVGRFIYALHRMGVGPDRLRALAAERRDLAPALAARAVALADRFDAFARSGFAQAADTDLQAMLDEALALGAALGPE